MTAIGAGFADRQPVYYASYFLGQRFAQEWTVLRASEPAPDGAGRLALDSLLELDPTVLGAGSELHRMRCEFLCDDELRPVRYRSLTRGKRLELELDARQVTAHLPDGSVRQLPRDDARFLVSAELNALWALFLLRAHAEHRLVGKARFSLFHANHLRATPFAVEPAPDLGERWYRTSHQQELELDPEGLLVTMRAPDDGIEIRREAAPPLPDWGDDELAVRDPLRYRIPEGATFTLRDMIIPGPVTPLGASITVPAGAPPFPAVLFLSGSGTHDRHGFAGEIDLGAHEVVDALAEAGFVGLRYDTRGAGETRIGEDMFEQGFQATVADARAALAYLRDLPEVDPRRICLVGHSQGGIVALALAGGEPAAEPPLRAIVLMAAPGRDMGDLLIDQTEAGARRHGLPEAAVAAQLAKTRQFVALVRARTPWVEGEVPDHMLASVPLRLWLLDHLSANPLDLITRADCPILILQGDRDFQISVDQDAEPLRRAGERAGREVMLIRLPGLDHLFKPVAGESTSSTYFDRSRRVDAGVLAQLAAWLGERARS